MPKRNVKHNLDSSVTWIFLSLDIVGPKGDLTYSKIVVGADRNGKDGFVGAIGGKKSKELLIWNLRFAFFATEEYQTPPLNIIGTESKLRGIFT